MMEAIAAFSLLCNVGEVIGYAVSIIKLLRQIRKNGNTRDSAELHTLTEQFQKVVDELQQQQSMQSSTFKRNVSNLDVELQAIASKCKETATELCTVLDSLRLTGGFLDTFSLAFKLVRKKGKLDALEAQLQKQAQVLDTTITVDLRRQIHDQGLLHEEKFVDLENVLQSGVGALRRQDYQVQQLIQAMESVALQVAVTEEHIKSHVNSQFESQRSEALSLRMQTHLLDSLTFPEMNKRLTDISDVEDGTYDWIFDSGKYNRHRESAQGFVTWLSSGNGIFWVRGKAGSGKSTLMRFLWEHVKTRDLLTQTDSIREASILKYGFWLSGDPIQRSLNGLYMSLLHQLLHNDLNLQQKLLELFPNMSYKRFSGDWSVNELKFVLFTMIKSCSAKVCVFVDGLDEIESRADYPRFLEFANSIADFPSVRLCVSSRPESFWIASLEKQKNMRLEEINAQDIMMFITNKLAQAGYNITDDDAPAKKLVNTILNKADGVFLWTFLVVNSVLNALDGGATWSQATAVVDASPPGILDLYRVMLAKRGQIDTESQAEASMYFRACLDGIPSAMAVLIALRAKFYNQNVTDGTFGKADFVNSCKTLLKRVPHISAGLIEWEEYTFTWVRDVLSRLEEQQMSDDACFDMSVIPEKYLLLARIKFSHRTVRDFLLDTEAGKTILDATPFSDEEIYLSRVDAEMLIALLCLEKFKLRGIKGLMWSLWGTVSKNAVERTLTRALRQIETTVPRIGLAQNRLSDRTKQMMVNNEQHTWSNVQFDLLKTDERGWSDSIAIDVDGLASECGRFLFADKVLLPHVESCSNEERRFTERYKEYLLLCCLNQHTSPLTTKNNFSLVSALIEQGTDVFATFYLPLSEPVYQCGAADLVHTFYFGVEQHLDTEVCDFWAKMLRSIRIRSRYCLLHVVGNLRYQYVGDQKVDVWIELDVAIYLREMLKKLELDPSSETTRRKRRRMSLGCNRSGIRVILADPTGYVDIDEKREVSSTAPVSLLDESDSATVLDIIDEARSDILRGNGQEYFESPVWSSHALELWPRKVSHDPRVIKLHRSPDVPKVDRAQWLMEKGYVPDPSSPYVLKEAIPRFETVSCNEDEQ